MKRFWDLNAADGAHRNGFGRCGTVKLIGSKTEQDFRTELVNSHISLFQDLDKRRLLGILRNNFPNMKTAYIIYWTPEQGENIYSILVNVDEIAQIELDRFNSDIEPIINNISLARYRNGLSRIGQIKLEVAIDLARLDLNS